MSIDASSKFEYNTNTWINNNITHVGIIYLVWFYLMILLRTRLFFVARQITIRFTYIIVKAAEEQAASQSAHLLTPHCNSCQRQVGNTGHAYYLTATIPHWWNRNEIAARLSGGRAKIDTLSIQKVKHLQTWFRYDTRK